MAKVKVTINSGNPPANGHFQPVVALQRYAEEFKTGDMLLDEWGSPAIVAVESVVRISRSGVWTISLKDSEDLFTMAPLGTSVTIGV